MASDKGFPTNLATYDWATVLNNHRQTDIILPDFTLTVDTQTQTPWYCITGKMLKWIEAFLQHRSQFHVVNGCHSSTSLVTSRVPQGSVLGPTLFLIFINDIVTKCSTSTLTLFADYCCVYCPINSGNDLRALHQDLTNLHNWSNK